MLLASVNSGTVQRQAVVCPKVSPVLRLRSSGLNPHAGGECQIFTMEKKMTKIKLKKEIKTKNKNQFLRNEKAV